MAKPIGARCNLDCEYCYYTEKSKLYQGASTQEMSEELLERFIKDYIGTAALSRVPFTWHGGEPLLRPLSFYQKVVELQKKHASGKKIENCIQTNGTLLTDEFCQFFKDNDWLVGVSLDGPKQLHDRFRKNRKGLPSFDRVMKGVSLLDKHGVPWNAMATVNRYNADYPKKFYSFLRDSAATTSSSPPWWNALSVKETGVILRWYRTVGQGGCGMLFYSAFRICSGSLE